MSKTTVIHHSADFDGLFCREIARKFLPDAEFIGWDFSDKPVVFPQGQIYILDLPVDQVLGFKFLGGNASIDERSIYQSVKDRLIWIDHHKSAIESHPTYIPGYRIDGVAACRLAWQWFANQQLDHGPFSGTPQWDKQAFVNRTVAEPLAVRLAGEYDVWDHRGDGDVELQFGLDSQTSIPWASILQVSPESEKLAKLLVDSGKMAMQCYAKRDSDVMNTRSFIVQWEGLKFLALTTARCNSNTFAAKDIPETGHDALMAFYFNGKKWTVSLYHANHRKDIDLSLIAVKYGGGGHRGACGFTTDKLPFLP